MVIIQLLIVNEVEDSWRDDDTASYCEKEMGFSDEEQRQRLLAAGDLESTVKVAAAVSAPDDRFHMAYMVYFTLGMGFLLPWNAFITAVDYFSYVYPAAPVDRVFSVAYMSSCLLPLVLIVVLAHLSAAAIRINVGLAFFTAALVFPPVIDAVYVRGTRGLYGAYDATVGAVVVAGVADALVQGGVLGSASELPNRYMQAVVSGTAASGVLVSAMRIMTKSIYPQDATGLRRSANLYFAVSIVIMIICIICYNVANRLPVIQYYKNIKAQALQQEKNEKNQLAVAAWRSTLWDIFGRIKWYGFGIFLIYVVTLSIFPGYITEDVHSELLKDWYPIMLIAGYNVFDLIGKSLTAVYLAENATLAVGACVARLLFYPLFLACLHGPEFFRTEIPVTILTCLLGLTNGYFTSVIMILAPKTVPIQHAETTGIVLVLFLVSGLTTGSIVSWFWVI
ncbi:Equilibrative nucleotide transporter 1 [Apostasia shenzhenica]|uniref:Equilibrative nucleotide transporter 1 n=1 Tax=Apostasia shenzhenica TaxID=1088818 RepID=A0A2I0AGT2_9ASPA|nr:Equilibrative nucleotide transporter 1 [Apostasia shenzhenica]